LVVSGSLAHCRHRREGLSAQAERRKPDRRIGYELNAIAAVIIGVFQAVWKRAFRLLGGRVTDLAQAKTVPPLLPVTSEPPSPFTDRSASGLLLIAWAYDLME
jgi:hypothetical protein